jgi:outer membrane protein assembly factor BamB
VRAPTIAADGEHIIAVSKQTTSVLDRSGNVVATFNAGTVVTAGDELVYAPPAKEDGIAHLVVGDWTGNVRLDLPIGNSPINAFAVDLTTQHIALGTEDGVVQIRSLQSGAVSWQASLGDRAGNVLFDSTMLRAVSSNAVVGFDRRGAIVWTIPAFAGTLDDLRERVRCRPRPRGGRRTPTVALDRYRRV